MRSDYPKQYFWFDCDDTANNHHSWETSLGTLASLSLVTWCTGLHALLGVVWWWADKPDPLEEYIVKCLVANTFTSVNDSEPRALGEYLPSTIPSDWTLRGWMTQIDTNGRTIKSTIWGLWKIKWKIFWRIYISASQRIHYRIMRTWTNSWEKKKFTPRLKKNSTPQICLER